MTATSAIKNSNNIFVRVLPETPAGEFMPYPANMKLIATKITRITIVTDSMYVALSPDFILDFVFISITICNFFHLCLSE